MVEAPDIKGMGKNPHVSTRFHGANGKKVTKRRQTMKCLVLGEGETIVLC